MASGSPAAREAARIGLVRWWTSGYAAGASRSCSRMNRLTIPRAVRPLNARGSDRRAIGDAAGCDQRQLHPIRDLAQQHQQAQLLPGRRVGEAAAVPTRLQALDDERVRACGGSKLRLLRG